MKVMEFNSEHEEHSDNVLPQAIQKGWLERTILIAEDDPVSYFYLECLLKDKVKRIDRAINGKEAVELALANNYNLILMDIKMPIMDGIEATKRIKQQFPDMPIIIQTADSTAQREKMALQADCDGYIVKPIKKDDLMEMIKSILP